MKSKWIMTALVVGLMAGCSSSPKYTLTGKLTGIADGTEILLVPGATHKDVLPEDTAVVRDGTFKFTGDVPEPRFYYLRVNGYYGGTSLFIENSKIELTADVKLEDTDGRKWAGFENVQVKGSPTHDLYVEKMKFKEELNAQYKAYMDAGADILSQTNQAKAENNQSKMDSLGKTEAALKFQREEKAFFENVNSTYQKAFSDNKDTWWGPFLMLNVMSYFTPEQQPWFEQFSDEAKNSYYGKILHDQLYPKSFVGEQAPAFSLTDEKAEKISFAELSKGKKYILIDFWASWCAPCRKEIPNLKKIYAEYASQGFEIVSISIDDDAEAWKKAMEKEQMQWPNFLDADKSLSNLFNIKAIPACFLVDEKGQIILENFKSDELEKNLKTFFKR
ncbi:MAG TPA: thioredoxin [Porphyromonadaceae bacterium]|uniref:redoxin domain-containing protein n=1 Tax=Limibacterium fermenti TaxID=3229863 RepID=UPI000E7EC132|nr:thioredoxin [Porphyromonadaceae bacterium]HBL34024.1 thioredoxin [Porphyromonadaceae bacterium]HBX21068.1 thioredoxin [Porphyromonadaceae bacterium]HBX45153.1 thioredoxin [Porphyromonadaceae bacterium]HCM22325.1 thioredoxin [Porphyromonadaceae bacterium]